MKKVPVCVESKLPADRMKANNLKRHFETASVVSVGHSSFLRGRYKHRQQENGTENLIMVP